MKCLGCAKYFAQVRKGHKFHSKTCRANYHDRYSPRRSLLSFRLRKSRRKRQRTIDRWISRGLQFCGYERCWNLYYGRTDRKYCCVLCRTHQAWLLWKRRKCS
jgi:hypothetical protein